MTDAALTPEELAVIAEEEAVLTRVQTQLAAHVVGPGGRADFDRELLELRDQLAEARAEDHAMLVEHMTRLAALRRAQDREAVFPANPQNPYFAHLRLEDEHEGRPRVRDVLIGRRPFIDTRLGVQIVDWRNSPISRIYYCYAEGDEYEEVFADTTQVGRVSARRTLTIGHGVLGRVRAGEASFVRLEDDTWAREDVARRQLAGGQGVAVRVPGELGGRPDGRLPEITALIDPEQFRVITEDRAGVVIIRGGAGTGKTTIALHRVAFLHFQDRRRFAGKRILVITPGDALRRYVSRVLPTLDVQGVPIETFPAWAARTVKRLIPALRKRKLTDETPVGARRLKRHPALLALLEQAIRDEGRAFEPIMLEAGGPPLADAWIRRRNLASVQRIDAVERWARGPGKAALDGRAVPVRRALERARAELAEPVECWADLLTDRARLEAAFAEAGAEVQAWEIDSLVGAVSSQSDEPEDLSDLDPEMRQGVDGRSVNEGSLQGRLDVDDLAILLRICQLKWGRLTGPSGQKVAYEHVVVDEAQDLSPMALKVLCDAVPPGGPVTLAGDTAQRLSLDTGFDDWDLLVKTLRLKAHVLPPLAVSYRSTRQVMALARHVLGPLAPHEAPRDARDGAPVSLLTFEETGEAVAFLADALKGLRARERQASVALVSRTPAVANLYYEGLRRAEVPDLRRVRDEEFEFTPGVDVTDVFQIKGLEYDYVVILEATAEQWPLTLASRHLLHVAMTRAAHQLWLVASRPPSPLLPDDLETLAPG